MKTKALAELAENAEENVSNQCLEPVQELLRELRARTDCVVPLWADLVASQLQGLELGLRDFQAALVASIEVSCGNFQARRGRGAANEAHKDLQRAEHITCPRGRDLAEESVLDGIPLRGSRRVVADRDLQPALVRELLQALLVSP